MTTMDSRFVNSFTVPARVRYLGRLVYPFCLKHRLGLMAIGSPLVTEGVPVKPVDLIIAAQLCSEDMIGDFSWRDRLWAWRLGRDKVLFTRAVHTFQDFVGMDDWPKFWEQTTKSKAGGAGVPWIMSIIANLIANGIDEQRAWEMPERQAIWMNTAFAVLKGSDISILTSEEEKFMEETRAAEDAAKAKERDHG